MNEPGVIVIDSIDIRRKRKYSINTNLTTERGLKDRGDGRNEKEKP